MFREGELLTVLARLNIDAEQRGHELWALCPGHLTITGRIDHMPSWSMNEETGAHHCFSCGFRGHVFSLVAELLDLRTRFGLLDFEAAKSWILRDLDVDLEKIAAHLEALKDSYVQPVRPVPMSEARLAVFSDPPDWALDARELSLDACLKYGVRWDASTDSWILPIRDARSNKLLGWQEKGATGRHFRNRPPGVKKSTTFFGLDCWTGGRMVVVESPLDAVRLASIGQDGGVAAFGASISVDQIALMRQAERLILAFDNDDAGRSAAKSVRKAKGIEFWTFNYGSSAAKDIGEMTSHQIEVGLETALHCAQVLV